jgi:arsenate reductase (thioredoxin)
MAQTRVLFVCIGNSCRSQMAEGFARTYGSDCVVAASAGVAPASFIAPDTMRAMEEKNIDLSHHFPKGLRYLERAQFDLVVNMSGRFLTQTFGTARMLDWDVADPIGLDYDEHSIVRDEIERRVMSLILELRHGREPKRQGTANR